MNAAAKEKLREALLRGIGARLVKASVAELAGYLSAMTNAASPAKGRRRVPSQRPRSR